MDTADRQDVMADAGPLPTVDTRRGQYGLAGDDPVGSGWHVGQVDQQFCRQLAHRRLGAGSARSPAAARVGGGVGAVAHENGIMLRPIGIDRGWRS